MVLALLGIMNCITVYGYMYMMVDHYKELSNKQAIGYSKWHIALTVVLVTLPYVALRVIRAMNSKISLNRTLEDII